MSANLLKLLFIAISLYLIYRLIFSSKRSQTLFEMHFKDGHLTQHSGKIPEKFERESRKLAKAEKLTATVRAERTKAVRLHISANVADDTAQRLRNLFPFELYDKKSIDNSRLTG